MALKRHQDLMATFSMASMTDVIFLLLIFFMVTSTFVFPSALEVNLPQSSQQTKAKTGVRIYLDREGNIAAVKGDGEAELMSADQLDTWLQLALTEEPEAFVALYADEEVPYGAVVDILDRGANHDVKIMLSTVPRTAPVMPAATDSQPIETVADDI